jgi:hypothetical protein
VLLLLGALTLAGTFGVVAAVVLVLLIMQLFVNVFTVPFTQELRWYGPGLFDWEPGLRNGLVAASVVGSVLLVAGGVRRYRPGV